MQKRILIVSQEVSPYISESSLGEYVLELAKVVKKNKDTEVRLFMPRYGCINERRHQLHEVIRLSGVNIVVNDIDQPLIVKVASVPQARLQVYFIDNDEYFQRKLILHDKQNKLIPDNDERMLFFCRGVLETLQMLGWSPNILHCHGWFSALLPLYFKKIYKDQDSVFTDTKIIMSLYKQSFKGSLDKNLINKIDFDGIDISELEDLKKPNVENLLQLATRFSDGVIFEENFKNDGIKEQCEKHNIPLLSPEDLKEYYTFYQNFFSEALV